jgi:hypothetical protein
MMLLMFSSSFSRTLVSLLSNPFSFFLFVRPTTLNPLVPLSPSLSPPLPCPPPSLYPPPFVRCRLRGTPTATGSWPWQKCPHIKATTPSSFLAGSRTRQQSTTRQSRARHLGLSLDPRPLRADWSSDRQTRVLKQGKGRAGRSGEEAHPCTRVGRHFVYIIKSSSTSSSTEIRDRRRE